MQISLLEPIGVSAALIDELAAPIREAGHTFTYYDTKTTDIQEFRAITKQILHTLPLAPELQPTW